MGIKELELELEDGTTIYRLVSKPPKISIGGKSVTAKALKEYMDAKIHNDGKSLDIVTSSSVMSAMQMNEFSEYLVNIIPVKVNFEKLKELAQLTDEEAEKLRALRPGESPVGWAFRFLQGVPGVTVILSGIWQGASIGQGGTYPSAGTAAAAAFFMPRGSSIVAPQSTAQT